MYESIRISEKMPKINKRTIIFEILFWLLLCSVISLILDNTIWVNNRGQIHTILELICIFIGASAFLTFWNTSNYGSSLNYILTFGFITIVIFDVFHVYYFYALKLFPTGYYDLYVRFYFLGRISEILVLIFGMKTKGKIRSGKVKGMAIALSVIIICFYMLLRYPNLFPRLATPALGVTKAKIYSEYIIIAFYLLSLLKLNAKVNEKGLITYRYIYVALSLAIPAEICFSLYNTPTSFFFVCGHILRIVCYLYVYKGLFVSAVTHPYKEIERMMSEDKIKGAFDYVNIGVAITDLNANIISVNKHLCKMLGYTEKELLQFKFKDITYEGDEYTDEKKIEKLFRTNTPRISFEKRYVHKLGYEVWVKVTDTFVYDINNKPMYVVTEIQDISSKKRIVELEERIEKDKKTLEETLELDKLRTEFFANLSHELRTPLNVIIGASQLTEFYIDKRGIESLDYVLKNNKSIKQNSRRLLRLVNNLIDTTKIDSEFFKLKLSNIDIVNLVEEITLSIAEYTNAKGIELVFDTEIEELTIACDPDKIERIMLNLLSNAIKFTDRGGTILVSLRRDVSGVFISIKDTGIGIPKDKQDLVFERFRQVDKSFTRNQEGSGIGLSLVKSLVELHRGKISVISSEGNGSEFIISLPIDVVTMDEGNNLPFAELDRVERIQVEFSDIYTRDY